MRFAELTEAIYAELTGRDGLPQRVWKNPGRAEFAKLVINADVHDGMRCLLTSTNLFFWQSMSLLHRDFVEQTAVDGVKINLRRDGILANLETIGSPHEFPWVFAGRAGDDLDMDERRDRVVDWLHENDRLRRIYGQNFSIHWYS